MEASPAEVGWGWLWAWPAPSGGPPGEGSRCVEGGVKLAALGAEERVRWLVRRE